MNINLLIDSCTKRTYTISSHALLIVLLIIINRLILYFFMTFISGKVKNSRETFSQGSVTIYIGSLIIYLQDDAYVITVEKVQVLGKSFIKILGTIEAYKHVLYLLQPLHHLIRGYLRLPLADVSSSLEMILGDDVREMFLLTMLFTFIQTLVCKDRSSFQTMNNIGHAREAQDANLKVELE